VGTAYNQRRWETSNQQLSLARAENDRFASASDGLTGCPQTERLATGRKVIIAGGQRGGASVTQSGQVLVTGAAGFIGFHTAKRLLEQGRSVVGIDNLNDYYDPALKNARLEQLRGFQSFEFKKLDLADGETIAQLFATYQFPNVVHLAAQAGVRYSLINPHAYTRANLVGFVNVLEGCRAARSRHLLYASSSSVYGANTS